MRHFSYANVVATLAVFIALAGGAAYAAVKVTGSDIVNGSVTGKDLKKHSVALDRLKGQLPAGPQGPKGIDGAPATRLWAVINANGSTARGSGRRPVPTPASGSTRSSSTRT
jgi:hypothetical protein